MSLPAITKQRTNNKYLTKKEIFDKVSSALSKQKNRSIGKDGKCMYRGPNKLKCAIGHLILDELYHESMEGQALTTGIPYGLLNALRDSSINIKNYEILSMLIDLQRIHDHVYPKGWRAALDRLRQLHFNE